MEAVVAKNCPEYIVNYLNLLNYKINRESTQSAYVRIKNAKGH